MDSMVTAVDPSLKVFPKAVLPYCMIDCLSYEYPKLFWLLSLNSPSKPTGNITKRSKTTESQVTDKLFGPPTLSPPFLALLAEFQTDSNRFVNNIPGLILS